MLKVIYGVMGSSKSANALMVKFNYEQKGFKVILAKPDVDTRTTGTVKSRIGLESECKVFNKDTKLNLYKSLIDKNTIIIIDECQFCTKEQIEQLKDISSKTDVFCYGLLTNFKSELFEGSKRLIELADELERIPHICECGKQALINARFKNGKLDIDGDEILIGDTEYRAICYDCWNKYKKSLKNF